MDGKVVLRILSALVLLAAVAGIAYLAFGAGVAQGVTTRLPATQGQPGSSMYPYYAVPLWLHPFPFAGLGFLGVLAGLFLIILVVRAILFLVWGPRWGHWRHMHGGWRRAWDQEGGLPPMFREWHDRAHGRIEPDPKL